MYRFYEVLKATQDPQKALQQSPPSAAMLGGIFMEACVAEKLGFDPWLPQDIAMDDAVRNSYAIQSDRVVQILSTDTYSGLVYQPGFKWPSKEEPRAEGHPDFCEFLTNHLVDLKTTEFPTEELLNKYMYSVQMAAYMAAYIEETGELPKLSIILASRLVEPEPVKFNKDGSVSLSGQKADHLALREAVELMGERSDERHWKMVYSAPTWNPIIVGTVPEEKCAELAKVGKIFLDAGIAILDTGLSELVCRPFA